MSGEMFTNTPMWSCASKAHMLYMQTRWHWPVNTPAASLFWDTVGKAHLYNCLKGLPIMLKMTFKIKFYWWLPHTHLPGWFNDLLNQGVNLSMPVMAYGIWWENWTNSVFQIYWHSLLLEPVCRSTRCNVECVKPFEFWHVYTTWCNCMKYLSWLKRYRHHVKF